PHAAVGGVGAREAAEHVDVLGLRVVVADADAAAAVAELLDRRRDPGQAAVPKRTAARARRRSASSSRSFGGATVTSSASRCSVACAISCTARSNTTSFAFDGF